jgi:hypothetical protein
VSTEQSVSVKLEAGQLQVVATPDVLKKCMVFMAFPRSRSANFPIALSLAQAGTVHGEQDIAGRTLYWAGFSRSHQDLKTAAELLRLAGSWVGAMAQINGTRVVHPHNAYLTISCYLVGSECDSQAAHCHKQIDDPFHPDYQPHTQTVQEPYYRRGRKPVKKYTFPCKRMLDFSMFHPQFTFKDIPNTTPAEQIQAAAVEYGISICPYFDASAFVQIGPKRATVDPSPVKQIRQAK